MNAMKPCDSSISTASPPVDPKPAMREIVISRWWSTVRLPDSLTATDGASYSIVFRGTWSHGLGPDFRNAMMSDSHGNLRTGSIEIHRNSGDWERHGHDRDPAYNDVILHLILNDEGGNTRRADGAIVPVVLLDESKVGSSEFAVTEDWSVVGGDTCAESISGNCPSRVRETIWSVGDIRMASKAARIEAQLASDEPATVLYRGLMDALGYSSNREGFRQLSNRVPLSSLVSLLGTQRTKDRPIAAISLLLGAAGFLPLPAQLSEIAGLSPADALEVETRWNQLGEAWHHDRIAPSNWNLTRVRPANHPVRRITAAALVVARMESGLIHTLIDALRNEDDPVSLLVEAATWHGQALLGKGRAGEMVVNAVIPFAMAMANFAGDDDLAEAAGAYWESMPASEGNSVVRRALHQVAGQSRIPGLGARGQQGLIQLDSALCAPRRCFECPIAYLVVQPTDKQADRGSPKPP